MFLLPSSQGNGAAAELLGLHPEALLQVRSSLLSLHDCADISPQIPLSFLEDLVHDAAPLFLLLNLLDAGWLVLQGFLELGDVEEEALILGLRPLELSMKRVGKMLRECSPTRPAVLVAWTHIIFFHSLCSLCFSTESAVYLFLFLLLCRLLISLLRA